MLVQIFEGLGFARHVLTLDEDFGGAHAGRLALLDDLLEILLHTARLKGIEDALGLAQEGVFVVVDEEVIALHKRRSKSFIKELHK